MRFIGNAPVDGEVRAIASGALATGDTVVVNSDGTVSVISQTSISENYGTPVAFESSSQTTRISSDMHDGVLVVTYQGTSQYLYSVVGTVSGETISFGSATTVSTSQNFTYTATTIDHSTGNVVVSFKDPGFSNRGRSRVASISGTTLTFGTVVQFESGVTDYIGSTYDVASGKVVISYADDSNSSYGTAVVGTISGTAISFGTPVVFDSAHSLYTSCVYAPDAAKVVVIYASAGGNAGRGVVGTVSGSSISFGSPVAYKTGVMTSYVACTYDTTNNRVVAAYRGTAGYAEAAVGTVSGTSISFGTPVVWKAEGTIWIAVGYSSLAGKVGVAGFTTQGVSFIGTVNPSNNSISFGSETNYGSPNVFYNFFASDYGSSGKLALTYASGGQQYGNAFVLRPAYNATNLTSENFVGFANSGYASGQSAALNSTCSVDNKQSGLTAGQTYYVQTDGSLGTSPDSPSVVAGTAISSSSIIVKG
jgi:hypothetical protein